MRMVIFQIASLIHFVMCIVVFGKIISIYALSLFQETIWKPNTFFSCAVIILVDTMVRLMLGVYVGTNQHGWLLHFNVGSHFLSLPFHLISVLLYYCYYYFVFNGCLRMQSSGRSHYNLNAFKCKTKALMMQVYCMIGPNKEDLCFSFCAVNLISENLLSFLFRIQSMEGTWMSCCVTVYKFI